MAKSKKNKSRISASQKALIDFNNGDSMAFLKLAMKDQLAGNLKRISAGEYINNCDY